LATGCSAGAPSNEVAVGAGTGSEQPSGQPPQATNPTDWPYEFVTTRVDGSALDTGDYAGTDLVLWFWAPW